MHGGIGVRRNRIWHALVGLFMGTAAQGCIFLLDFDELEKGGGTGGVTGSDGADGALPIPLKDAAEAIARATCDRAARCMGPGLPLLYFDEDCIEATRLELNDQLFSGMSNLDPATFVYHDDVAPGCVESIRSAPCDQTASWGPACNATFEGMIGQGGPCTHPSQCAPGLFCKADSCPGTCEPRFSEGAECLPGLCREDLRCQAIGGKNICSALAAEGAQCAGDVAPSCQLGLYCVHPELKEGSPGICRKISDVFTSAEAFDCSWLGPLCGKDLYCRINDQTEATAGTFKGKCIRQLGPGDDCVLAIPDPCPKDYYCDPGVFVPPDNVSVTGSCHPVGGPGEECKADSFFKPGCKAGTICIGKTLTEPGTCQALLPLGTTCTTSEVCYSKFCGSDGCAPPNFCKP